MGTDKRWMLFVDGENLTHRTSEIVSSYSDEKLHMKDQRFRWEKNGYFWRDDKPGNHAKSLGAGTQGHMPYSRGMTVEMQSVRSHYYTSIVGDLPKVKQARKAIKSLHFDPHVVKVPDNQKQTFDAIDVQLATDLIGNAYRDNYDVAILVGGDGDYIPAVREVKRYGKTTFLMAYEHEHGGLNEDLRMECDYFIDLFDQFLRDRLEE